MRVLLADVLDVHVLAKVQVPEVVVAQELQQRVGADVPGSRDLDLAEQLGAAAGPSQQLLGEEQPCALSSKRLYPTT